MKNLKPIRKKIIIILIILNFFLSLGLTFSYWASQIIGNQNEQSGEINIGDWGIPIFTTNEFYDFATRSNSSNTDRYYLANNLDFTGFTWNYTPTIIFRGQLSGNHKTISNLEITVAGGNYHGIFPRMNGGKVFDITFNNVMMISGFSGTSQRSGLIVGEITGGTVDFENITILNSSVSGTSSSGVGGIVGLISGASTVVNIKNVQTRDIKVFNLNAYSGGLVGRTNNSGSTLNMEDIDFHGEIYSNVAGSYVGGLVGRIVSGGIYNLNRAVIEARFQNTLVTTTNYLAYSQRYLGGIIGYNLSQTSNVNISNVLFTGSLFNQINNRRLDVGNVTGRHSSLVTLNNVNHSFVEYRSSSGGVIYVPDGTQTGQSGTLVNAFMLPNQTWWNDFYDILDLANDLWTQDINTGRTYLIR